MKNTAILNDLGMDVSGWTPETVMMPHKGFELISIRDNSNDLELAIQMGQAFGGPDAVDIGRQWLRVNLHWDGWVDCIIIILITLWRLWDGWGDLIHWIP